MTRRFSVLLAAAGRDERGASAVEFAIVCFPLLLFMFGILEFGRAVWIEEALQSTAAATARCVGLKVAGATGCTGLSCGCANSSGYSSSLTTTYAQNEAKQWGVTLTSSNITSSTTATSTCQTSTSGTFALVNVQYAFSPATTLIPGLQSKTLSAQACYPMSS